MPKNKDLDFPTVRYMNNHTGGLAFVPKEDYNEDGKLTLRARELHRKFMSEENDVLAAGYREAVHELAKEHLESANKAANNGAEDVYAKEMMRHLYALHCLSKMVI